MIGHAGRGRKRGGRLAVVAVLAVPLPGCGADVDAWRARYGYEAGEVHGIRMGDTFGFPQLPVVVNGDTLHLVFDTGNMVGVMLPQDDLDRLGLPRVDEWTSLASDGSVVGRYGVHRAERVSVLGRETGSNRIYELGQPNLPGLVGPQFLRGLRWTVDYERRLLAVTDRPTLPGFDTAGGLPLVRSSRHPALLLVYGRIGDRRVLMELDTGKSRTTIDPELAEELGLSSGDRGVEIPALEVGPFTFRIPAAKPVSLRGIDPTLEDPILVGIGSDLLRRVVLTVDSSSGTVWFHER